MSGRYIADFGDVFIVELYFVRLSLNSAVESRSLYPFLPHLKPGGFLIKLLSSMHSLIMGIPA